MNVLSSRLFGIDPFIQREISQERQQQEQQQNVTRYLAEHATKGAINDPLKKRPLWWLLEYSPMLINDKTIFERRKVVYVLLLQ